jgi:predicted RNA binding protein YcfA (HicA-like mRNA interferase family)
MPPVPLLRPNQVVKIFEKFGWQVARQKGSHIIMIKEGHIATLSIPNHPHVARGTLRSLIQKSGLTVEQFTEAIQ